MKIDIYMLIKIMRQQYNVIHTNWAEAWIGASLSKHAIVTHLIFDACYTTSLMDNQFSFWDWDKTIDTILIFVH